MKYNDPTYVKAEIDANPVWKLAFRLSELHNDSAPLGWSAYIPRAERMIEIENPPRDAQDWTVPSGLVPLTKPPIDRA